ncbi:MAG: GNAT family N-acetyltransferase [Campylobacterota bacterium]|nr:GNAT family N-acetyltransferase [Campylobacterota bacterium]
MNFSKDITLKYNDICFYFKYLDWDSNFFNKPSYLLDINKSNLGISNIIQKEIEKQFNNCFLTVKIDASFDYTIISFLQVSGFTYIDTEVILEYGIYKNKLNSNKIQIIKEIKNNNLPYDELGKSFSLTRFHTDLNIDNAKADILWINYLKNYELSDNKHMFSAKVDSEFAGIILVNINEDIATLFFVAVVEKFRGLGIGTILIQNALEYFKDYVIRTETQIKNINALNFYIGNGLNKIQKTLTVLHRW